MIFWFSKKKSKETENATTSDSSKEKSSLDPPKEVPELTMDQYPLEESAEIQASPRVEEQKPMQELPKLIVPSSLQQKPAQTVSQPQPVSFEPKAQPQINLTPISQNMPKEKEVAPEIDDDLTPEPFEGKNAAPPPKKIDIQKAEQQSSPSAKMIDSKHPSFFSHLKEKIIESIGQTPVDEKIIGEMKSFHENAMVTEKSAKEKAILDSLIASKIVELELLEEGWYYLRKELDSKQILLDEKERLIDQKVTELKALMKKAKEEKKKSEEKKQIPFEKWFVLSSGKRLSSIEDLASALSEMENHTFFHHVTPDRNDFSSWIRHVFEDHALADKIIAAKTKEDLIRILQENYNSYN